MITLATWLGIAFCVSQSAMFSGLNLAVFSLNRLKLEIEARSGSVAAQRVLRLREDSNLVLTTILWGNVSINVLLTLLSDSVLAGVVAFLFSTFAITIFGEIMPQAYFSRNAMKMASMLAPLLRAYQLLLYPVARPSAMLLDAWLGREAIQYYREAELKEIILQHLRADESEMERAEAMGALNFLNMDDLPVSDEGVPLHPDSIIQLPVESDQLRFPDFAGVVEDPFLRALEASGKPWAVLTDTEDNPRQVLDVDGFLRSVLFHPDAADPRAFCHRPVIVRNRDRSLGDVITRLWLDRELGEDQMISRDVILLWDGQPRIITGADLLGRLMEGIARDGRRGSRPAGELSPA
ncbi:DUF21 domain-containing protein [Pseudohaliea sp.]|uniref:DUF21 domain-containing protein n=1 Tax=Pseudohaliea sp. TaxID=2740289 RepID=UPI0032EC9A1B